MSSDGILHILNTQTAHFELFNSSFLSQALWFILTVELGRWPKIGTLRISNSVHDLFCCTFFRDYLAHSQHMQSVCVVHV